MDFAQTTQITTKEHDFKHTEEAVSIGSEVEKDGLTLTGVVRGFLDVLKREHVQHNSGHRLQQRQQAERPE